MNPYATVFVIALVAVGAIGGGYYFMTGGTFPSFPQQSTYDQDGYQPAPQGYVPFSLTNVYMNIMNALDEDATFGADDATLKVYNQGAFSFTSPSLDSDGNAATTGQIDLDGKVLATGTGYTALAYQGDGGTNLYAKLFDFTIPPLNPEITFWTNPEMVYMYTEGAFTESGLDASDDDLDEAAHTADEVTLDKSDDDIQGCLSWDFTMSNSVSGSIIKDPVIVFEDSASDPLTDLDDIEEIYLSVKSGSGFSFPSGNLRTQFLSASPIPITSDGSLGSADGGTGTLKICLPAAEANVGTGDLLMHFDDLGDYRARDLDNDVRAAAETTTFNIQA